MVKTHGNNQSSPCEADSLRGLYNQLQALGIQNIDMAPKIDIDRMRVASPCHVDWDSMTGDDRARFCGSCDRHVYNVVGLTRPEIESLVENTEGRLCVRMYQRPDATVLTEDCPVGLRLIRKRVATFAGAALSALLGLVS
ncbi:MAG: hypothetical protein PSX80_08225, partial [bacterium]|nr:hypothetical protein [bacterium]